METNNVDGNKKAIETRSSSIVTVPAPPPPKPPRLKHSSLPVQPTEEMMTASSSCLSETLTTVAGNNEEECHLKRKTILKKKKQLHFQSPLQTHKTMEAAATTSSTQHYEPAKQQQHHQQQHHQHHHYHQHAAHKHASTATLREFRRGKHSKSKLQLNSCGDDGNVGNDQHVGNVNNTTSSTLATAAAAAATIKTSNQQKLLPKAAASTHLNHQQTENSAIDNSDSENEQILMSNIATAAVKSTIKTIANNLTLRDSNDNAALKAPILDIVDMSSATVEPAVLSSMSTAAAAGAAATTAPIKNRLAHGCSSLMHACQHGDIAMVLEQMRSKVRLSFFSVLYYYCCCNIYI